MLEAEIKAGLAPEEYEELDELVSELERLKRIHRAETDLLFFAWEYFSETRNPGNSGNWDGFELESLDDAAKFHQEICASIDEVSNVHRNAMIARAAPRSHGKSTYLSKATPLRETVFRKRKYIIIISETPTVSESNLEWLSGQLKTNAKLRADFGPLLSPKQQMNDKDNSREFVAWEPIGNGEKKKTTIVQAASTGQALRGRNWDGTRPDLIIGDDLEDIKTNAATKEQREKLRDWFSQTVMPLGDPKGEKTAFIVMGTVVHEASLLNDLLHNRADFKSHKYKALIEMPERMDLWGKCQALYQSDQLPINEREVKAKEFYEANRAAMNEGAVVLWPEVQPIWKLMTWKWANGSKAFNTEYQNEPRDEESMIFNPDIFRYFDESDLIDREGRRLPLDYYAFWDVAAGKSSRSDYNAIVTLGRDRRTGVMYVIDAWAKKCPAHKALEMAVEKIREYGHKVFAVETIGVGHDMHRQLRDRLMKERIYGTKLKPIAHQGANKEKRIEALEPLCETGFLRFKKGQSLLLEQLEQFPSGQHDDLPDACSGVVSMLGTNRRKSYVNKPPGL
ncbi:phage terminase large subunit [Rossellomorea marisflavi]|uniref:phage terminase large subunit n=1 Tax=Rossellomorea marisflavi TaxID=189381 RepID=UPI0028534E03|nr:phage terminase large subunit [Rossellomorea marisflavi]MDR4936055.1 phage terminase large subunit [Rossellomorea marisflavi]